MPLGEGGRLKCRNKSPPGSSQKRRNVLIFLFYYIPSLCIFIYLCRLRYRLQCYPTSGNPSRNWRNLLWATDLPGSNPESAVSVGCATIGTTTPPNRYRTVPVIREKNWGPGDRLHAALRVSGRARVQGQAAVEDLVIVLHPVTQILLGGDAHARQDGSCITKDTLYTATSGPRINSMLDRATIRQGRNGADQLKTDTSPLEYLLWSDPGTESKENIQIRIWPIVF